MCLAQFTARRIDFIYLLIILEQPRTIECERQNIRGWNNDLLRPGSNGYGGRHDTTIMVSSGSQWESAGGIDFLDESDSAERSRTAVVQLATQDKFHLSCVRIPTNPEPGTYERG